MNDEGNRNSLKNYIFQLQKGQYLRCLEPEETCVQSSIRAHSIQNRQVLELLQQDGHVVMPQLQLDVNTGPKVRFESVGRNKASTFSGLCTQHDAEIFAPIEKNPIDVEDDSHLFLLTYRAVLKEAHASIEAAIRNQLAFQKKVELKLIPGEIPTSDGFRATGFIVNSYETYLYKRDFDRIYLDKDFSEVRHHVIFVERDAPTIAVNSLFTSADNVQNPSDTERIILNVFPVDQGTYIVFSYLGRQEPAAKAHLTEVLQVDGHYRLYLISKLVLRNCENFVIAPKYFQTIPNESQAAMLEYFQDTLRRDLLDHEDTRLYLF